MRQAAFALLAVLGRATAIQLSFNATALRHEEIGGTDLKIPLQIVMTAKEGSIDELPPEMRDNVRNTLELNPKLKVRFLSDADCSDFIASNFGSDLHSAYVNEKYGAYRGDICRAAVVALEGGFYADLDMQFRVPFSEMVDSTTTFMSSLSTSCEILNAFFGAERGSKVMQYTMEAIKDWYKTNDTTGEWMGTATMMRGLEKAVRDECPEEKVKTKSIVQNGVQCGPHQNIRLYREHHFNCPSFGKNRYECTPSRFGAFDGLRYGIFEPDARTGMGPLLAWSRFEACRDWGCGEKKRHREGRGSREAAPGSMMCRD